MYTAMNVTLKPSFLLSLSKLGHQLPNSCVNLNVLRVSASQYSSCLSKQKDHKAKEHLNGVSDFEDIPSQCFSENQNHEHSRHIICYSSTILTRFHRHLFTNNDRNKCFRNFSTSSTCDSQNKRPARSSITKLKLHSSVKSLNGFVTRSRIFNGTGKKLSGRITSMRQSFFQNENLRDRLKLHRKQSAEAVRRVKKSIAAQVKNKENIKTIPNLLTTLRMSSAPLLAYLVVNEYFVPAFSIFVIAGLTDMLDGYIARNFKNQRTALGTALDPLADKLLMCFLTVSLTYAGLVPAPLTALILGRDAGLIAGSFYIRYISLAPPRTLSRYFDVSHVTAKLYPSTISKVNTLIQLSYVALTLAAPVFHFVDSPYLTALMYTTAATTFLSGADYVLTWRRRLKIVKNE